MFVELLTDKGRKWVKDNLSIEPWQVNGDVIAIDHHYAEDILQGMFDEKIYAQKDYIVL